ncbi:MAG TPA: ABC-2 family transporter protein [Acidimicrobiales bacterium]|nr:ABC-2 family transporter protein [Acidimicrobiales bacterium]
MGGLRLYLEVARRGFRRFATYRAATVAGVSTNTVFGFVRAYILIALYHLRPHLGGLDLRQVVTYTFVTQGYLMPMALFGWTEIEERVRTGDIIGDLYRPVDFQGYWLALDVGRAAYQFLARGVPPVLVAALFFSLRLPTPGEWALVVVSSALGLAVSFGLRYLVNLTSFWLLDARGLSQMLVICEMFLGGIMIPITVFPHGLEAASRVLPFASVAYLPVEFFLGRHTGSDALATLGIQALWAVVLLGAGRIALGAVMRKLVVQGG